MILDEKDLKYIARKLASSSKILKGLTEENRDVDLLLNSVSVKRIKKEDSLKISPLTYIKLIVFRYSYDSNFNIDEKDYIAKTIYTYYTSINVYYDYSLINTSKLGEKKSQYLLVLAGFFHERFPIRILYPNHKREIELGFRTEQHLRPLSEHVTEWLDILKEINRKKWLDGIQIKEGKQLKTLVYKPPLV